MVRLFKFSYDEFFSLHSLWFHFVFAAVLFKPIQFLLFFHSKQQAHHSFLQALICIVIFCFCHRFSHFIQFYSLEIFLSIFIIYQTSTNQFFVSRWFAYFTLVWVGKLVGRWVRVRVQNKRNGRTIEWLTEREDQMENWMSIQLHDTRMSSTEKKLNTKSLKSGAETKQTEGNKFVEISLIRSENRNSTSPMLSEWQFKKEKIRKCFERIIFFSAGFFSFIFRLVFFSRARKNAELISVVLRNFSIDTRSLLSLSSSLYWERESKNRSLYTMDVYQIFCCRTSLILTLCLSRSLSVASSVRLSFFSFFSVGSFCRIRTHTHITSFVQTNTHKKRTVQYTQHTLTSHTRT